MNRCVIYLLVLFPSYMACSQEGGGDKRVGGPCEGCEALFEYGNRKLNAVDTLPDFNDQGPRLKITGTIYQKDGETPAEGVILYIYHTNQGGMYPKRGDEKGWARRHGYIRGWIKTGRDGRYTFYTLRPGAYPGGENPEHIHATIKEPGYAPYWIDDYLFADDPILKNGKGHPFEDRGGKGVLQSTTENGLQVVRRDIILGLNIPGYE